MKTKPLYQTTAYRTRSPKGSHVISIWVCPIDSNRFSFAIAYGGGLMVMDEYEGDRYLSGKFSSIEEAAIAAISMVKKY